MHDRAIKFIDPEPHERIGIKWTTAADKLTCG